MTPRNIEDVPVPRDGEPSVRETAVAHLIPGTEQEVYVTKMRTRPVRLGKGAMDTARVELFKDVLRNTEDED